MLSGAAIASRLGAAARRSARPSHLWSWRGLASTPGSGDSKNTQNANTSSSVEEETTQKAFFSPYDQIHPDQLTKDELDAVVHPDKGQNVIDKYAFAIEVSEGRRSENQLNIEGIEDGGFYISGQFLPGAAMVLPDVMLSWDVKSMEDFSEEHLAIIEHLDPPLDLLIVGTGKYTERLPEKLTKAIRKICPVEVTGSFHAGATFNMLSAEGRVVGALMLPLPEDK